MEVRTNHFAVALRAALRRTVAVTTAALLLGLAATPAFADPTAVDQAPPGVALQGPATYSFVIGEVRVTALSDGTVPGDVHALLRRTSTSGTDALLKGAFAANPIEISINEWVFRLDGRVVLIDTGAGGLFGAGYGGKLLQSLAAAGFAPGDVTDVLLTHIHTDHSGGLVQQGKIVFPAATIHVGAPDVAFFLDRSNAAKAHVDIKYFDEAIKTVKPYLDAGRIKTFDSPTQIMPGLMASVHPGHTPGSAFYELTSGTQTLVFVGDIVHVAAVQLPKPAVTITYDVDQSAAANVREKSFAMFAHDRTLIAAPHLPFPGVGHVRALEDGYQWVPIEYGNRGL